MISLYVRVIVTWGYDLFGWGECVLSSVSVCGRLSHLEHVTMSTLCNKTGLGLTPPEFVTKSDLDVTFKELFILFLFFLLFLYSILSFLHNWSKNYRGINHLPYYNPYQNSTNRGMEDKLDSDEPRNWQFTSRYIFATILGWGQI